MKHYVHFFPFIVAVLLSLQTTAQDSLRVIAGRTVVDSTKEKAHSPTFAAVASAIVPGAGQVYNNKYWKVPIVYAALGTAAYFAYLNGTIYFTIHDNLNSRIAEDTTFGYPQYLKLNYLFSKSTIDLNQFSNSDLETLQEDYRRYFTLSIIAGSVIYALNILDAVVDAHLYSFDVSDDLSMNVRPEIFYTRTFQPAAGFSLALNLK